MTEDKKTPGKRRVGDGTPGPGRPKGMPNKTTAAMKEIVREAFENAGGVAYLAEQAKANPTAFMTLLGKLLPLEANLHHDGTVTLEQLVTQSLEPK